MDLFSRILSLAIAWAFEMIFGYPRPLYARIGHPVTWMGALVAGLDRRLNVEADSRSTRRSAGIVATGVLVVVAGLGAYLVERLCLSFTYGFIPLGIIASSLIASKSLAEHVENVAQGLETGGLAGGRKAVSMIVGRNPETLDEPGVCRAAIESLAENFSDGVVAPVFWYALLGLPGIAVYKIVNTADSMIGHRTPRHEAFGWASARLDDWLNLIPARLTALILSAAAFISHRRGRAAMLAVRRDAGKHRSPNAGWPEAAMAGALDLRLAGPRVYGETVVEDAYMGDGRSEAGVADIRKALNLFHTACVILSAVIGVLTFYLVYKQYH
ncbi:cobalamin biosynthesis protein CobD [Labrys miyagiensis]|uniref:Cobalamin biosynthesis protein CobD n=1 Tax=Labrys miyagiensis TaxID=346912 RepID=A0ABQ6CFZ4_9HYPH|nr:adenosylcobinamide-phosphate synthase CbiB [Labrys miyagiensis]GLS17770.1 cobalamin biosynthesis protein CobD [Labrys miyagiensis]